MKYFTESETPDGVLVLDDRTGNSINTKTPVSVEEHRTIESACKNVLNTLFWVGVTQANITWENHK